MPTKKKLFNLKVAVTGHDGFIGRWLVKTLKEKKVRPVILKGDVRIPKTWNKEFDVLFHLAALTSTGNNISDSHLYSVNVGGTMLALEACHKNKAHIIFPSTSGVYKQNKKRSLTENDPLFARSPYTESKMACEKLCEYYSKNYKVKSTILRLFNPYGAGQDREFLLPYLLDCLKRGKKARITHPRSYRDFIYITDVIDAMIKAIGLKGRLSCFNVGSGKPHSVLQIIEMMRAVSGKPLSYQKIPAKPDPFSKIYANIKKANKSLNWKPKTSLKQGLSEFIHAKS